MKSHFRQVFCEPCKGPDPAVSKLVNKILHIFFALVLIGVCCFNDFFTLDNKLELHHQFWRNAKSVHCNWLSLI